ncbi:MAG: DNA-3-methyladenine glycosylase [Thaumarchaeota archaeon]|nr:DNA-3-methyladenine glycosylase [Nitrososphaerota archaeon]
MGRGFFERYTPLVARELLGLRLVRRVDGQRVSGMIVETEAYRGSSDPASHAYKGRTARNSVMFGPPGHAYVYFTMGMHFCLNVTTEPTGIPAAVLIRAIEPLEGVDSMKRLRGLDKVERLASGPGNLTRAMGIDKSLDGEDLVNSDRLSVEDGKGVGKVGVSTRVGIGEGQSLKWRFFAEGNPFVSKGRPSKAQNP